MPTFPLGPIHISATDWVYVDTDHMELVHETVNKAGAHYKTDIINVPWSVIRLALACRDGRRRPRKARKT